MRDRRTVFDYREKGAGTLLFGSSEGVRRMGTPNRLSDVAREMYWPVMLLAYWTLGVVWVVHGEMVNAGSSGGAWVGLVAGWVVANVAVIVRAVRVARGLRVVEVAPGAVVLREPGHETSWPRREIAGVRRGPDFVGLEVGRRGRGGGRVVPLVSDLPGRELARAAGWLREALRAK